MSSNNVARPVSAKEPLDETASYERGTALVCDSALSVLTTTLTTIPIN
jgi:hypothetical protein